MFSSRRRMHPWLGRPPAYGTGRRGAVDAHLRRHGVLDAHEARPEALAGMLDAIVVGKLPVGAVVDALGGEIPFGGARVGLLVLGAVVARPGHSVFLLHASVLVEKNHLHLGLVDHDEALVGTVEQLCRVCQLLVGHLRQDALPVLAPVGRLLHESQRVLGGREDMVGVLRTFRHAVLLLRRETGDAVRFLYLGICRSLCGGVGSCGVGRGSTAYVYK